MLSDRNKIELFVLLHEETIYTGRHQLRLIEWVNEKDEGVLHSLFFILFLLCLQDEQDGNAYERREDYSGNRDRGGHNYFYIKRNDKEKLD